MKKLGIALLLIVASFGVQAQTKAKATTTAKKETTKDKCAKICLDKKSKSCCSNEKALSALRRPVAKPVATKKTK